MSLVIALHRITGSAKNTELVHSGSFDAAGNAILKKQTHSVLPGSFFEVDDETEFAELLAAGAIRHPSDAELALFERGIAQTVVERPDFREIRA